MERIKRRRLLSGDDREGMWTGLILVIIGGALLVRKINPDLPSWLFTWPMLLILIGVITAFKHNFRNPSWLIFLGVGGFFLADEIIVDLNLKPYFWPIIIMGIGLVFILRPRKRFRMEKEKWEDAFKQETGIGSSQHASMEDIIDSTSIFGGVKKVITSKDFKGGEIVCLMGGAEINLSQADIAGPVTIEMFLAFGGAKLIVPPHWEVRSETVAIFGGIEDKRAPQPGSFDPKKVLVIDGTAIFGGVEIKSY
jgi:predicted membrane protein